MESGLEGFLVGVLMGLPTGVVEGEGLWAVAGCVVIEVVLVLVVGVVFGLDVFFGEQGG